MEQLNFFDYLGLDQYTSDEDFLYNLQYYSYTVRQSEHHSSYLISYKACGENKTREFPCHFFVENKHVLSYIKTLSTR